MLIFWISVPACSILLAWPSDDFSWPNDQLSKGKTLLYALFTLLSAIGLRYSYPVILLFESIGLRKERCGHCCTDWAFISNNLKQHLDKQSWSFSPAKDELSCVFEFSIDLITVSANQRIMHFLLESGLLQLDNVASKLIYVRYDYSGFILCLSAC